MKHIYKHFFFMVGCCLAVGQLAGCTKCTSSLEHLFDGGLPEIKVVWAKTVAADLANEYVTAANGYQLILSQADKLSVEQCKSVAEARSQLFSRLHVAAKRGDSDAVVALDTLHRSTAH